MNAKVHFVCRAAAALLVIALSIVSPVQSQEIVCFPSCDEADGRFLVVATGAALQTLGAQTLRVKLAVPRDQDRARLEFFDGDSGATDDGGIPHWDLLNNPVTFTLYADPNTDGSELIELDSLSSDEMLDNDWLGFNVATDEIAQADSGNFFYQLEVVPGDPDVVAINALKIRSTGFIYFGVREQPFSFMAAWTNTTSDIPIVYPNFNPDFPISELNLVGANYDGSFDFYLDLQLAIGQTELDEFRMWDGDLDRGDFDGGNSDSDDLNTPNDELPFFDVDQLSVFEGIAVGTDGATGAPPDDVDRDSQGGFGIYNERSPSVAYSVRSPRTEFIARNNNPSGNIEWEQFSLTTGILDPEEFDAQVPSLAPGVYNVELEGMDMNNLNAWFFEGRVLCQRPNGEPCIGIPRAFILGDTVWFDPNENEVQDPGEPGIPGVVMNLLAADSTTLATTLTNENGRYFFDVDPGDYTVEVAAINFAPAARKGAVGDFVWLDVNSDGIQDPFEPGIPGVEVVLFDAGADGLPNTLDDNVVRRTQTDADGFYLFRNLDANTYYTGIDENSLRPGLALTGGTDPSAARTILSDEVFLDLDFGYALGDPTSAALGDRVWSDLNNDGFQDPGEPGIGSVTLVLTRISDGLQVAATTTEGGYYLFTELDPGDYEVTVTDVDGVLTGYTQTAAPGIISVAGINVTGDFGYFNDTLFSVSDSVWFDVDRDGLFDANESGIPGVTVSLTDALGDSLQTTVTDADGDFSFDGLDDGSYILVITDLSNRLSGLQPTTEPMLAAEFFFEVDGANVLGTNFGVVNQGALVGFLPTTPSPTQDNTVIDQNVLTYDFGYVTDAGLGDFVWLDLNGDGVQDPNEPGIPNVRVTVTNDVGDTEEMTTDADGGYFFELFSGTYRVNVDPTTLPAGVVQTFDLDGVLDNETIVELLKFEVRFDVDFGYQPTDGTIGDTIWRDDDGDGVEDPGEPGIPNVRVDLKDENGNVLDTQFTDGNGMYLFESLAAGTYTVCVDPTTLPDGLVQTGDPDGVLDNETTVPLDAGDDFLDADFGYQPRGSIGDTIWEDTDRDGVEDPGEPGIPGVTVLLKDENGNVLDTEVTDGNGMYLFEDLAPGIYTVCVDPATLPQGYEQTGDPDGVLDNETTIDLGPAENELDADFGYNAPPDGSIGDRVWFDDDGDGVQDPGEAGINGVTVRLLDKNGNVLDTQVTSGDGTYLFTNLPGGFYTVVVDDTTLPGGVRQTGDPDGVLDNRTTVELPPGGADLDNDFGYQPLGSIGDTIWLDQDGDGIEDPGEPGIPGVTVLLKDANGNVLDTMVTDGDGMYLFADLPEGIYTICVDPASLPPNLRQSGDPDGVLDNETTVVLDPGENELDADFGYQRLGRICGTVWEDLNGNGVQDPNEPGIPNVVVELFDANGNVIDTVITDADGNYCFEGVPGGNYEVCVDETTIPADYEQTFDPDGILDGCTDVNLPPGGESLDNDFGYQPPPDLGQIGDTIWFDRDGDGVEDPNEPGIPGVTVLLKDEAGNVIDTQVTDADGMYLFDEVPAGTYTICVDPSTLPPGSLPTGDPDGNLDNETTIDLDEGEINLDIDFGYDIPDGCVPGFTLDEFNSISYGNSDGSLPWAGPWVENDPQNEGAEGGLVRVVPEGALRLGDRPDSGDEPSAARPVNLANNTNAELNFDFVISSGADPDDIAVAEISDDGGATWTVLEEFVGLPGEVPIFDSRSYDITAFMSADTQIRFRIDTGFGEVAEFLYVDNVEVVCGCEEPGSVGDRVWFDDNGDGVQDPGEPGINDVTITLLDEDGNVLDSQATSGDGNYLFEDLAEGTYTVRIDTTTLPPGLEQTFDPDGSLNDEGTGFLRAGFDEREVDFGYTPLTGRICGTVWEDLNGNGIQDAGEPGIPGVPVDLFDENGNVIDTVITDANGNYCFEDVRGGDYEVCVNESGIPAGYEQTGDPDPILDGCTDVNLPPGGESLDNDFGYQPPGGSIGDTIWNDLDGDGVEDPNEPGIPGVTVLLKDAAGNVLATMVTDDEGMYLFTDLPAGTYRICVDPSTLPPGFEQTGDPDGTLDNETTVSLDPGENELDADFGYKETSICPPNINFDLDSNGNPLEAGRIIDDEFDGIRISSGDPIDHPIMIFDSANPTGGDDDLGTPNETFGGPGIGEGGEAGEPGENAVPRGNVLIISEDADPNDPDDNGNGGTITFEFERPVEISHLGLLDVEESGGSIQAFDSNGNVITSSVIPILGDNAYQVILVGATTVSRLDVNLASSGAITDLVFCADLCVFNWDGIGGRAFTMPEISEELAFEPDPGSWQEQPNGRATITGELTDQNAPGEQGFVVDIELSDRYNDSVWTFYGEWSGTLTGMGNWAGAVIEIVGTGDDFQLGYGANGKDEDLGISAWFDWTVTAQPDGGPPLTETGKGDINADIADCDTPPDPVCAPKNVRDEFEDISYRNNDGENEWRGDWVEDDPEWDGDGPDAGAVRVRDQALRLDDNEDTGGEPSAARKVDLSAARGGSCTLSYEYDTDDGVDPDDAVTVEISHDGGATYSTLDVITGIDGNAWGHDEFDITSYASAATTVRFRVSAYYGGDDEHIWLDDIDIRCVCP